MSKVLKIVGAAVGLVAIVASGGLGAGLAGAVSGFLGVGASTLTLISAGLAIGATLLAPKPKVANSTENIDRLRATIDPRTPRKIAIGITALKVDVR